MKSKWGKDFFSVAEIGSILYMYLIVDAFVNDPSYRKGNIDLDRVLATIRDVKAFFKWIRQDGNLILNDDELNCTDIVSSFGIQEYCISCSQEIVFDTANPYKATCDACDISIERCVHTFRLVINVQRKVPDLIELDANTLSEEIYFCPSCHCSIGMTNLRLIEKYHSVKSYKVQLSKHYSGNKTACFEGVDSSAQFAGLFLCASSFCPYCLISMRHL